MRVVSSRRSPLGDSHRESSGQRSVDPVVAGSSPVRLVSADGPRGSGGRLASGELSERRLSERAEARGDRHVLLQLREFEQLAHGGEATASDRIRRGSSRGRRRTRRASFESSEHGRLVEGRLVVRAEFNPLGEPHGIGALLAHASEPSQELSEFLASREAPFDLPAPRAISSDTHLSRKIRPRSLRTARSEARANTAESSATPVRRRSPAARSEIFSFHILTSPHRHAPPLDVETPQRVLKKGLTRCYLSVLWSRIPGVAQTCPFEVNS